MLTSEDMSSATQQSYLIPAPFTINHTEDTPPCILFQSIYLPIHPQSVVAGGPPRLVAPHCRPSHPLCPYSQLSVLSVNCYMTNNNHSLFEVKCLTQFAITLVVRAGHSECSPTLRVNCRHFLENYQRHLGQFDTQDRFHASKKEIKKITIRISLQFMSVSYKTYLHLASRYMYLHFTVYGQLTL